MFRAVRDVSISMRSGETLGIVGESGSGKSVTALSIMNLIPSPPGEIFGDIYFNGQDEWGAMVADGVLNFNYWWIGAFPGLAILTMAVGTNFIGDSLRDFLDPRLRKEL